MNITTQDILNNDFIINDLKISKTTKYCNLSQSEKEKMVIEKFVYKNHNEIFINQEQSLRPIQKCIFTLHTSKKASFVEIFDNNNNSIFVGNSLWANASHKSFEEHLEFITKLHSTLQVKENYSA